MQYIRHLCEQYSSIMHPGHKKTSLNDLRNAKDPEMEKERERSWKQVGGQKLDEYAAGA